MAHRKSGASKKNPTANKTHGHGVVSSRVTDPVQSIQMQLSDVDVNGYNSDDICQECEGNYENDDETRQQDWIGCDVCPKWFHYQCVGLDCIPDDTWLCPYCADC